MRSSRCPGKFFLGISGNTRPGTDIRPAFSGFRELVPPRRISTSPLGDTVVAPLRRGRLAVGPGGEFIGPRAPRVGSRCQFGSGQQAVLKGLAHGRFGEVLADHDQFDPAISPRLFPNRIDILAELRIVGPFRRVAGRRPEPSRAGRAAAAYGMADGPRRQSCQTRIRSSPKPRPPGVRRASCRAWRPSLQ